MLSLLTLFFFHKYLLSIYYVLGAELDAEGKKLNKIEFTYSWIFELWYRQTINISKDT